MGTQFTFLLLKHLNFYTRIIEKLVIGDKMLIINIAIFDFLNNVI